MKRFLGFAFVVSGAIAWIYALFLLIAEHERRRTMPPLAVIYFIVPSLVIYAGVRLYQRSKRVVHSDDEVPDEWRKRREQMRKESDAEGGKG
jgi:hypothetical protein